MLQLLGLVPGFTPLLVQVLQPALQQQQVNTMTIA
jgi:hypothetical protein